MVMSIQTSREAARILDGATLQDTVQIYDVAEPITVGTVVSRPLTPVGQPVLGLVQTSVPQGAIESVTERIYSVKVPVTVPLQAGQAVKVLTCVLEPELAGHVVLVESMSLNGAALIRKGFAKDTIVVNQQGKEALV